jgi:hypothetical protein
MRYYELYSMLHVIQLIAEPHSSVLWGSDIGSINRNVNIYYNFGAEDIKYFVSPTVSFSSYESETM